MSVEYGCLLSTLLLLNFLSETCTFSFSGIWCCYACLYIVAIFHIESKLIEHKQCDFILEISFLNKQSFILFFDGRFAWWLGILLIWNFRLIKYSFPALNCLKTFLLLYRCCQTGSIFLVISKNIKVASIKHKRLTFFNFELIFSYFRTKVAFELRFAWVTEAVRSRRRWTVRFASLIWAKEMAKNTKFCKI